MLGVAIRGTKIKALKLIVLNSPIQNNTYTIPAKCTRLDPKISLAFESFFVHFNWLSLEILNSFAVGLGKLFLGFLATSVSDS